MSFIDSITPKNTEELKPNLFIQRRGNNYRQVNPLAWDGKVRWEEQLKTIFSIRTFLTLGIIIFLVWSYIHDVQEYQEFYEKVFSDPTFCGEILNDFVKKEKIDNQNLDDLDLSSIKDGETSDPLHSNLE